MLISVIIPTYNRRQLLSRALESVTSQSGSMASFDIIIVDDGSTDGTASMLKSHFSQVRLLLQTNRGVSSARNLGIQHSEGKWIAFLDSDDVWHRDKIARQCAELSDTGRLICHTEEWWIRHGVRVNPMAKHRKPEGDIFQHCLPLCAVSPSSVLLHRCILNDVGNFDETLPACEDYDMWLRIFARYPVALVKQPCITKYGGHKDQLSRRYWGMDRFRIVALEKILATPLPAHYRTAALTTLLKKLSIVEKGARKHKNHALQQQCFNKMRYWQQYVI